MIPPSPPHKSTIPKSNCIKKFIRKIVSVLIKPILYEVASEISKNITFELQYRALQTTVDFIKKEMKDVDSTGTNLELLDKSLSCIKNTSDGLICEFGVFSGRTINYIAKQSNQTIYGFDSFEGLPERWRDGFSKGHFKVVKLPKVETNVTLIKGWFNHTLSEFLKEHPEPMKFLHIDCDLYTSTQTIFELCKERIVKGTVIVFDEYFNYNGWEEGEYKAFQEFITENNIQYEYIGYNRNYEQVAVIIL
jgi:hypothetical protein